MSTNWYCVNESCGAVLGVVSGNELEVAPAAVTEVLSKGPNIEVTCKCGTKKVWYTSEPVVRAMYQLVDSMANMLVRRLWIATKPENVKKIIN